MRFTFRTKLLASHVALVLTVVLAVGAELYRTLGADLQRQLDARIEAQARGAAAWVVKGRHPSHLAARLAAVVDARVTIVDEHFAVLGDSQAPDLTRADEPEVRAALQGDVGRSARVDAATGVPTHYVAVPAAEGLVLRLGVPLSGIEATLSAMRARLLYASGLALIGAIALGLVASRVTVRPVRAMQEAADRIARGDYRVGEVLTSRDELGALSRALASLAAELEGRMAQVRRLEAMRRDFVANASHELRTPVTAIQGFAETLQTGSVEPERARQYLTVIHRHAQRIGRVVEGLLQLSAIEARAPESVSREPVVLGPLAEHVAEALRGGTEATLTVDVTQGLTALGDPVGVEQILENLLGNAVRYGKPRGSVRVRGRLEAGRVRLDVEDDGPGVASEHLPHLFERFYRVDAARSREQGGTGLGLSIVKHLVEAMDGTVSVESELGKGCRFTVLLPAGAAQKPSSPGGTSANTSTSTPGE